ncbi:MAG TPA: hypothetical protein VFV99_30180 [Kofleriaceae bacterium]|nr:hypothetical protein [Kofleriaceae bacterium]
MSIDFNALFGIGSSYCGADWLRGALAAEPPGVREAVARFRHLWTPEEWTAGERDGSTSIVGPGGFSLDIYTSTASLYHVIPWARFTRKDDERGILRRACFEIASLLDLPRALYLHELLPIGPVNNLDLQELETQLRASFGAPSSTFEALANAGEFSAGCWYVDDFADLNTASSSR